MRDDFIEETKRNLAQRAGNRCSNPACGHPTSGPRKGHVLSVNIGVAAHIHAASPGGARFDQLMLPKERRSIGNAIWLCQTCAKLIDNDAHRYTAEKLYEWKTTAEHRAVIELEHGAAARNEPSIHESREDISSAVPPVRIELNVDHSLRTLPAELDVMIARLAVGAAQGTSLRVEVVHPDLDSFSNAIADPVTRAQYRRAWEDKASRIAKTLQLLFSKAAQETWSYFLSSSARHLAAAKGVIAVFGAGFAQGTKLDVWRTRAPALAGSIYLSDSEVDAVLSNFEFESKQDLAMGAGWRAADELPADIIVAKVIPRILFEVEVRNVDLDETGYGVIALDSWHIGLG